MARMVMGALALGMLAGCGDAGKGRAPEPRLVSIETYLASPDPNDATLDRAHRRCQTQGATAVFVGTTQDPGARTVTHIYQCLPGSPPN